MMKAIRAALDPSDSQRHVRVVCFMTDGFVGNDMEIIAEVQKHPNARVFSFGIGNSVNRFLLDRMAEHGRGEVEYVTLGDDGSAAARRFHERVQHPLLTEITIDWAGLPVEDVYPARIPDLFSAKPVVLSGRYTGGGRETVRLRGRMAGREFTRELTVVLPESEPAHDVIATLWARSRVEHLMSRDYRGVQFGQPAGEIREAVTQLGLEFRLLTQFTSFVAVEEMVVTDGDQPRRIEVPVEMPEGVRYEGVFGEPGGTGSVGRMARQKMSGGPLSATIRGALPAQTAQIATPSATPPPPQQGQVTETVQVTAADRVETPREQQLRSKLHPSLAAIVARLEKRDTQPGPGEAKFVRRGRAEVQLWLAEKSQAALEELKRLGFEVVLDQKGTKLIIGRLPIEKLAALAALNGVRYVAPLT